MNYDPNMVYMGKSARQLVRLLFQVNDYTAVFEKWVHGNVLGLSVIRQALGQVEDELETTSKGEIRLVRENGDATTCELWEFSLEDMLVSAQIMEILPDGNIFESQAT